MSKYVAAVGKAVNITGTAAVTPGPCQLLGFYVNSTSSGTVVFRDGGASGTVLNGAITPAIGWREFPADIGTSLHCTIANAINITLFVATAN